jgi:hypothetical protein
MIELAKEILNIEWEIMRLYSDRCGEIGEFDFEELLNSEAIRGEEEGFIAKTVPCMKIFHRMVITHLTHPILLS